MFHKSTPLSPRTRLISDYHKIIKSLTNQDFLQRNQLINLGYSATDQVKTALVRN